jgi:nucleoside-diphosphate-sugar epimerase
MESLAEVWATRPYPALTGVGATRLREGPWRIVVAGAGGWLGLATLELLRGLLGDEAFAERVRCFGSAARTLFLRAGFTVEQKSLNDIKFLPRAPTLVLHLAFLTQEKAKAMSEADYVAANRAISAEVLSALDVVGAHGVFVASSGAVYMADDEAAQASMRLYGRLKLEDEESFSAWARAGKGRAIISRIFNISGPYINKQSSYALACFIADALAGRPIEIKARRAVFRSYVAISELMSVAFGLLTDEDVGVTCFDTAGTEALEMAQIAADVARALGQEAVSRPALGGDTPDRYLGDGAAYADHRRRLAVEVVDFPRQVAETARFMFEAQRAGFAAT